MLPMHEDGAGGFRASAREVHSDSNGSSEVKEPLPPSMLMVAAALAAVAIVACLLVQPELGSLVAPALGPWAGLVYGHLHCTMANAAPQWSWAGVAAMAVAIGGVGSSLNTTSRAVRVVITIVLGLALLQWFALAWLSALNATE
jgi:hypothetical protein